MSQELNKTHCVDSIILLACFWLKWAKDEKIRHDYRILNSFSIGGIMQNSESQEARLHKGERVINKAISLKNDINAMSQPTNKDIDKLFDDSMNDFKDVYSNLSKK